MFFSKKQKHFGEKNECILPEVISSDISRFGYIEESVASFIINYVSKGDCLIDVGAHFGFFHYYGRYSWQKWFSSSFEPTPSTFSVLKKI